MSSSIGICYPHARFGWFGDETVSLDRAAGDEHQDCEQTVSKVETQVPGDQAGNTGRVVWHAAANVRVGKPSSFPICVCIVTACTLIQNLRLAIGMAVLDLSATQYSLFVRTRRTWLLVALVRLRKAYEECQVQLVPNCP